MTGSSSGYSRESAVRVAQGWPPHQRNLQRENERGRELSYYTGRGGGIVGGRRASKAGTRGES